MTKITKEAAERGFVIEKQGYSSRPWRVLWADTGNPVWVPDAHPTLDYPITMPACFDRKRDAQAWLDSLEAEA